MASQNRPASPSQAPDPATNYERAKPEKEAGMGSLDSPVGHSTPADQPERADHGVSNAQNPTRQINAHDDVSAGGGATNPVSRPLGGEQPDHSMHDEEPTGWDQAPTDIHDPQQKRHPRQEGKGGTK
jgi:hypothetical protein